MSQAEANSKYWGFVYPLMWVFFSELDTLIWWMEVLKTIILWGYSYSFLVIF